MMDTQNIEIIGECHLITQLVSAGIEVAKPLRDHGIDLLIYRDTEIFKAIPLQIKTYRNQGFCVLEKYAQFPSLLMVYVWNIENQPLIYVMTYEQSLDIAKQMNWLETKTWQTKKHYYTNAPSKQLRALLAPYLSNTETWKNFFA